MLIGHTFFAGDSITVHLPTYVDVQGEKIVEALGGRSSKQILSAVQANPNIERAKNMVVLGGTNDIGSGLSAEAIFGTLVSIWQIGKSKGLRVIALTVPPAKGYVGFTDFATVNAKRHKLNDLIKGSSIPDMSVDLDVLLGDPADPDKLAAKHDSGDHLHPRKDTMGAALNTVFSATAASPAPVPGVQQNAPPAVPTGTGAKVVIGTAAATVGGYSIYKLLKWKGWFGL
jgi:hypothetical protein